jgi:hypothetical protein
VKARTDRHAVPTLPRRNPKMLDETRETRLAATVETTVSAALKAEALDDEEPGVVAGGVLIGALLTYSNALPVEDARWFVEDVGPLPGEALAAREVEERALAEDITATVADIVCQGRHREPAG